MVLKGRRRSCFGCGNGDSPHRINTSTHIHRIVCKHTHRIVCEHIDLLYARTFTASYASTLSAWYASTLTTLYASTLGENKQDSLEVASHVCKHIDRFVCKHVELCYASTLATLHVACHISSDVRSTFEIVYVACAGGSCKGYLDGSVACAGGIWGCLRTWIRCWFWTSSA